MCVHWNRILGRSIYKNILLNQYVAHRLYMFVSVICTAYSYCLVSTRVRIHRVPSPAKAYSRLRTKAVILLVTNNAYSDPGFCFVVWYCFKTLLVTVSLQGGLCPNKLFPRVRPIVVVRYTLSAIREKRELAFLCRTMKFISWPSLIPRQILEKGVLQ